MSEPIDWVRKLSKVRKAAIAAGLPTCLPSKSNVEQVVRAVNERIRRYANYTQDTDVNWNRVRVSAPRYRYEMWASWAYVFLTENELEDDCDAYAWTALIICLALGVPDTRLAFAIVRSESARDAHLDQYDHAIGIWIDNSNLTRTLGDTWDQARHDSCVLVERRHDLVYVMKMSEPGKFERVKTWFKNTGKRTAQPAAMRGRPKTA